MIATMWFSIELQATTPVPEWGGQPVRMAQEEDMILDAAGKARWALRVPAGNALFRRPVGPALPAGSRLLQLDGEDGVDRVGEAERLVGGRGHVDEEVALALVAPPRAGRLRLRPVVEDSHRLRSVAHGAEVDVPDPAVHPVRVQHPAVLREAPPFRFSGRPLRPQP